MVNTTRTIGQDPEQQNEGSVQPETGLEGHEADRCIRHDPSAITQNTAIQQPENPVYASGQDPGSLPNQADSDSPEMLYAQIAERTVSANGETIRHFGESYFLGETFSLTYVVHDVLAPFLSKAPLYQKRLHFPIAANKRTLPQQPCPPERGNIASGQVDLLKRQGLYSRPPRKVMDHLLRLYFDHFHPAFPIVDKTKYFHAAQAEQESQFVLNAVLMIAVTHCHKDVLVTFGCEDRHAARSTFYRQARCLYDSDAEHDKLNTIRGLFLMSFWWGGPNEQKDSWHWLAIAISLAQSLGLHRR